MLDRQAILEADDKRIEKVDVPEWGGHVFVRTLTGAERDAFERDWTGADGQVNANFRAKLAARAICFEDGKRVFADGDVGPLGEKSSAALDRVFAVAIRLNGLTKDDVEELEKN